MCVLIVKNSGVKMPSNNILNACAISNPDGFGIATPETLFKTLNKDEFLSKCKEITPETPAIIHCRLATHGSVKTENCHPFEFKNWVFAHNGILHNIIPFKDKTDSETAFLQIFMPLIIANKGITKNVSEAIGCIKGFANKFAFMNKENGKIYTFGEFTRQNGVLYSNTRWRVNLQQKRPNFGFFGDPFNYRNEAFYKNLF